MRTVQQQLLHAAGFDPIYKLHSCGRNSVLYFRNTHEIDSMVVRLLPNRS